MVATDTVVGIVGAVLLVGVMVGIYVYEFNQAEDTGIDGGSSASGGFAFLDAAGDIDGDGIANADDSDVDGDGVPNAQDNATAVAVAFSGSLGPQGGPVANTFAQEIAVENGTQAIRVNVTWTSSAPSPLPPMPNFQVRLVGPGGDAVAQATTERSGNDVVAVVLAEGGLAAGTYTLEITESAGIGGSFSGEGVVEYG